MSLGDTQHRKSNLRGLWPTGRLHIEKFLTIFAILTAAFLLVWYTSHYVDEVVESRRSRAEAADTVANAGLFLASSLVDYAADIRVVAKGQALNRLAAGFDGYRDATADDFATVVQAKIWIDQLRFLNTRGQEVVRVDGSDGTAIVVPTADLQDKSDRYYFTEAIGLPENALYLSAIDLNVEHGVIETPLRPTLRVTSPLTSPDGIALGVVVMNVSVRRMLREIERMHERDTGRLQLVNADGYWLAGAPDDQLWGFMYGRDTTLAKAAPGAWHAMSTAEAGEYEGDDGFATFLGIRPAELLARELRGSGVVAGDPRWILLSETPKPSFTEPWRGDHLPGIALGLVVAAVISLGWSRASVARRDAEDRRELAEEELYRSEQMASLGRLVAGVAHELNTPIGNAVTVASTVSERVNAFELEMSSNTLRRSSLEALLAEMKEGSSLILQGLGRASELIRHFKQIAIDQTSAQRRRFRLSVLMSDVVAAMRPQFKGTAVELVLQIADDSELDSYPGPLGQVLSNLIANAVVHGFPEGGAGTVSVVAKKADADHAEIEVSDTGSGMTEAVRQRIFEPFFTTRLGEGGSGLGLSIVFNIVTTILGGKIEVESRPRHGTSFRMTIPVTASSEIHKIERAYYADRR